MKEREEHKMNRDPYLSYAAPEETGISSADITDFLLSMNEHEIMRLATGG